MRRFYAISRRVILCRGAVGYVIGGIPPKAGGVMLVDDFLNAPTAIFQKMAVFLS